MNGKTPNERIIFGLKIRQLRLQKGLSPADLSKATDTSVSYLNEIEKGKKFPKKERINKLADALEVTVDNLLSDDLDGSLAPIKELLQSNFLNELPLDLFGLELGKIAGLIASAPLKVGAFISTLLELSRSYALREENFFFAALRAYLELNNNYFEDIETAVNQFCDKHQLKDKRPLSSQLLIHLLEKEYGYKVIKGGLDDYPELHHLRSVYLSEKQELLLNGKLTEMQAAFQLGKEIAFNYLDIKERAFTSSILKGKKFEEVLNHAYATYFSVALHLPKAPFVTDMEAFFQKSRWDGEAFLDIMQRYNASPEMFYHRLTNVIPQHFNMPKIFFLRFLHDPKKDQFEVDRELHLSKRHHPHGNALLEHYCRRWVSLSLLNDLHSMQKDGIFVNTIVRAQRSHYFGTDDEYLCLTLARPGYPSPNHNVSVTLGLLINDDVRKQIKWLNDPSIQYKEVNQTCERCPIQNCKERAAAPLIIEKRERYRAIKKRLKLLNSK